MLEPVTGRPDVMALAQQERADLLLLLRSLSPEQWQAPSLCSGWSVRDVAAHVVSYDVLSTVQTGVLFARTGFRFGPANARALARLRGLGPPDLLELVARCQRPRGLTAAFGGRIGLTDCTIHHQDIRRALGLPRTIAPERLRVVLDFALIAPPLPARGNGRGLLLTATDLAWSAGSGPEVFGPGEALLMAVAGRADALAELSGPGLATLRGRVLDL